MLPLPAALPGLPLKTAVLEGLRLAVGHITLATCCDFRASGCKARSLCVWQMGDLLCLVPTSSPAKDWLLG